jgi:proteasome lid subunit RPN8/RPN11
MTSFIPQTIRAFVAPKSRIVCKTSLWRAGLSGLARRGNGERESGAFLLGRQASIRKRIERFVFYDDLDPNSLNPGYISFSSDGYPALWAICSETGLHVVADVHTHPGKAYQSEADRLHPMIGQTGHVALIIPQFAKRTFAPREIGIFEYMGANAWTDHSRKDSEFFYVGIWG